MSSILPPIMIWHSWEKKCPHSWLDAMLQRYTTDERKYYASINIQYEFSTSTYDCHDRDREEQAL